MYSSEARVTWGRKEYSSASAARVSEERESTRGEGEYPGGGRVITSGEGV